MRKLTIIHLVIFICLAVFAFSTHSAAGLNDGLLHVYFLDVGQGDSIFIESPAGTQVLVDGGPNSTVLQGLAEKMPFFDDDLDVVIATHRHIDHIGGLVAVLDRYSVGKVIYSSGSYESPAAKELEAAVTIEGAKILMASAGTTLDLGGGAELTILHPFKNEKKGKVGEGHEDMVVALLKYGAFELILTGDMEASTEKILQDRLKDFLKVDVLKVGHHGSKTSTTEDFLKYLQPQAAVIQVGEKNKYGHPAKETLERLKKFDITYYRNDTDGEIEIISDGIKFQITK